MNQLLALVLLLGTSMAACASSPYKKSDHFDGSKFFNPGFKDDKNFLSVLKWKLSTTPAQWPKWVENTAKPNLNLVLKSGEVAATFINHATVLLQFPGLTVLTDPIWSERTSPVSFAGPKRVRAAGVSFEELPKVDVVVVSHNHYDHLDIPTLKKLSDKFTPIILVPLGDKVRLEKAGVKNVQELDWEDSVEVLGSKIVFVQVQHWSARGINDRYESLWGGFIIEHQGRKVYFGGDTGYASHFKKTREKHGPMDFALLPIGAYEPRWFMKHHHMNPEEAVQAHLDLEAKLSMGVHFGTFQLTDEGFDEPVKHLNEAKQKLKVKDEHFLVFEQGETKLIRLK